MMVIAVKVMQMSLVPILQDVIFGGQLLNTYTIYSNDITQLNSLMVNVRMN